MATITFRRSSNINDVPVIDGQIVFDTARNIILMDNGNTRNQYAGATQLISTTPEATSTNAYNALATNQLFLQKTTVLDTKANALAVTQKYIPLGCLAFKEALGTTDYSRVGNGTISGGLVYLNNQMNNQLTANGNKFYFDYQDGKYGYNTDPQRGADTFLPFSDMSGVYNALLSIGLHPASASEEDVISAIENFTISLGNGNGSCTGWTSYGGWQDANAGNLNYGTLTIRGGYVTLSAASTVQQYDHTPRVNYGGSVIR